MYSPCARPHFSTNKYFKSILTAKQNMFFVKKTDRHSWTRVLNYFYYCRHHQPPSPPSRLIRTIIESNIVSTHLSFFIYFRNLEFPQKTFLDPMFPKRNETRKQRRNETKHPSIVWWDFSQFRPVNRTRIERDRAMNKTYY